MYERVESTDRHYVDYSVDYSYPSLYRPPDYFKEKTYTYAYVNILEHAFTVTFGRHLVITIFLGPIP